MISQKVKDIINQSEVKDLLTIDDENNMIVAKFLRIRMETDIRGQIELYLFGYAFQTYVFFNDVDEVCLDPTSQNQYVTVKANDIRVLDMSLDPRLVEFFNINLRIGITVSEI